MTEQKQVKHTPGPWTPEDNVQCKDISHFAILARHQPDWMICSVTPMRLKREQDVANARLIAAAPELLHALKRIIAELPANRDWLDPDLEREAKATIARAEGVAQ